MSRGQDDNREQAVDCHACHMDTMFIDDSEKVAQRMTSLYPPPPPPRANTL